MQKVIEWPWLALMTFCFLSTATAQTCKPVEVGGYTGGTRGGVFPTGKYCLTTDLEQRPNFDIHSMSMKTFRGAAMLSIGRPPVGTEADLAQEMGLDIHLLGHKLEATAKDMIGIKANVETARTHIHDGTIIVPGSVEPNVGIGLHTLQSPRATYARLNCGQKDIACGSATTSQVSDKAPPYTETHNVISKVKIQAGWLGVQLVGIGNSLRNSVIEVDSRNGIAFFGPSGIIENNTIIVRGQGTVSSTDGALTLWDGNGAIVRNNRFIFKGWFRKAPPAIRLIDSGNVQLEGNTFEGFSQVIALTGKSSYSEKK